MTRSVVTVQPRTDQETVAILALRHNLKSIPVVDKENLFLGVVPSDVILEILHTEDIEDILRFAGISKNTFATKIFQASPGVLTKLRLPFGGLNFPTWELFREFLCFLPLWPLFCLVF